MLNGMKFLKGIQILPLLLIPGFIASVFLEEGKQFFPTFEIMTMLFFVFLSIKLINDSKKTNIYVRNNFNKKLKSYYKKMSTIQIILFSSLTVFNIGFILPIAYKESFSYYLTSFVNAYMIVSYLLIGISLIMFYIETVCIYNKDFESVKKTFFVLSVSFKSIILLLSFQYFKYMDFQYINFESLLFSVLFLSIALIIGTCYQRVIFSEYNKIDLPEFI